MLDEPTASPDAAEVNALFAIMRRLASEGVGIIFITHFLDQVYEAASHITVLRNGKNVETRAIGDFPKRDLVGAMLGRTQTNDVHRAPLSADRDSAPIVSAKNLRPTGLGPVNLDFRAGEIVGAAGLLGSGRTETAMALFGASPATGVLEIRGRQVALKSPRDAMRAGFGFVSEDRKRDGLLATLSIRENIIVALQARQGFLRPLSRRRQNEIADHFIRLIDIKTPDAEKPIGQLSGGNQQKALLARWLATEPTLLILDEPTRGVDIGAHEEILKLIDLVTRLRYGRLFDFIGIRRACCGSPARFSDARSSASGHP